MMKPLDPSNGRDARNKFKVILVKSDVGEVKKSALFYPTREKAREIANFLNELMPKGLMETQVYVVRRHKLGDLENY